MIQAGVSLATLWGKVEEVQGAAGVAFLEIELGGCRLGVRGAVARADLPRLAAAVGLAAEEYELPGTRALAICTAV